MFHDLNVCVAPEDELEAVRAANRLGYDVIALTTTVRARKLGPEHAPRPIPTDAGINAGGRSGGGGLCIGGRRRLQVLRRITLVIDDVAQLVILSSAGLSKWDLVAITPTSEKLFQQCLQFDFDIVALDFARKQQFYLKRPQLHVVAEKGAVFEISYAGALGDGQARRFLVGNAYSVSRVTMGRQTILSSGATNCMVRIRCFIAFPALYLSSSGQNKGDQPPR